MTQQIDQAIEQASREAFADVLQSLTNGQRRKTGVQYERADEDTQRSLTTTRERVTALSEQFHASVGKVRERDDLTPDAKRSRVAGLYRRHAAEVADIRANLGAELQQASTRAQTELFSIMDLQYGKEPAAVMALNDSYRAALDRAETIDTPDQAQQLMTRAQETGDELLARAVAHRAGTQRGTILGRQWNDVLHSYVDGRPNKADALQRFDASELNLHDEGYFVVMKPSEVSGLSDAAIEQVAEQFAS